MKNFETNVSKILGNVRKEIQEIFQASIKKNKGYKSMKKISAY